MDLHDLIKLLRRSWWLVAAVTVVCVAAAAFATTQSSKTYASHIELFVAAQAPRSDLQATYQGGLFTTQRVASYARLASSPLVTGPVVRELGLKESPTDLGKDVSAVAPPETVLIDITVKSGTAAGAQRIASSLAKHFIEAVERLERPSERSTSPVRLDVSLPATLPAKPVAPRPVLNLLAGLVLGLLLGLSAAFVRSRLDTRISAPSELPAGAGTALLGTVPLDRAVQAVPAVGLRKATPARAEALRRLRTNLRFIDPDHPPRTIVLSAATPGEGTTTTAAGLAMAMADAGVRVILVEGDLRTPRLSEHLGLLRNEGVSGLLVAPRPVDELLQGWPAGMDGGALHVLQAGQVPPNPSELLGSQRMKALLAQLRERCDIVLVDAPPLLPVSDAALLATEADGVLLVARMGQVTRPELRRALQALARVHARVLGVVANGVPAGDRDDDPGFWEPATAPPPMTVSSNGTGAKGAATGSW
jgi:succinoglycan biosynthesis transport protein ExoP